MRVAVLILVVACGTTERPEPEPQPEPAPVEARPSLIDAIAVPPPFPRDLSDELAHGIVSRTNAEEIPEEPSIDAAGMAIAPAPTEPVVTPGDLSRYTLSGGPREMEGRAQNRRAITAS